VGWWTFLDKTLADLKEAKITDMTPKLSWSGTTRYDDRYGWSEGLGISVGTIRQAERISPDRTTVAANHALLNLLFPTRSTIKEHFHG
jgi:hypothetical protein